MLRSGQFSIEAGVLFGKRVLRSKSGRGGGFVEPDGAYRRKMQLVWPRGGQTEAVFHTETPPRPDFDLKASRANKNPAWGLF